MLLFSANVCKVNEKVIQTYYILITMKVSEVFNPGGFPVHTYNPRNQLELEKQFADYLDSGYKLLSLTGPTKSGKTVLCLQLISKEQGIWISGGDIREENDFWLAIVHKLELYTETTVGHDRERTETVSSEVTGGLSAFIANVGSNVSGSESTTAHRAQTVSRAEHPRTVAINALNKQKMPIIVDDFHYIPHKIQINIVRSLKTPIFEGLRLVLISVPHRAYDTVKIESEMVGRVQQLKIPLWGEDELIEISKRGFPHLNIKIDNEANKILANESFGNPQLMQEFCANFCKFNKITESLPLCTPIPGIPKGDFFSGIADVITSKVDYDILARGPRQRSDRKKRAFVDGSKGDIYKAILTALANTGPKTVVEYEELRSKLRSVLMGDLPQLQQVSRVLAQMERLSSISEGKPKILEWDNSTNTLYLLDPYFAFYLRWAIRDKSNQKHLESL